MTKQHNPRPSNLAQSHLHNLSLTADERYLHDFPLFLNYYSHWLEKELKLLS